LYHNIINQKGIDALAKVMTQNVTLIDFPLGRNQVDKFYLKNILVLIDRNYQSMLARRKQFIFQIIMLAQISEGLIKKSLWVRLPKEIKLMILNGLLPSEAMHIGKTYEQASLCLAFIFDNIHACNSLIKSHRKLHIMERKDIRRRYSFFFNETSSDVNHVKLHLNMHNSKKVTVSNR
jgi:hypothetical protein